MANSKISGLPAATTPLVGTEILPIVQGGVTDQVSVANLTAGRAIATGNLTVTGTATVSSTADVAGNFSVATNKFNVTAASGNTTTAGTLGVTGDFSVNTNKFNVTASSGNTSTAGTLSATGDFAVNTNKFNVTASSGNTTVAGTLGVTGLTTATGGLAGGVQSLSGPGAVNVTTLATAFTSTGTGDALTLANGTAGQIKTIVYVAEAAGGDTGVLTPTSRISYASITLNAVGDSITLQYLSAGWAVLAVNGATITP